MIPERIDAAWFRTFLLEDLLPHWLTGAVTDEGLFLPQLDRRWQPCGERFGGLVSQTRLLYNFAVGYDLTGDQRYLDAVDAGARFLVERFRDPEHGGFYSEVLPGGAVRNSDKDSYGHAFAIFGLAHAYRVTRVDAFKAALIETWEILTDRFADTHGGMVRRMSRDFRPMDDRRSQNPLMHLFEALLAAGETVPAMYRNAERLAEFVIGRLVKTEDGRVRLPEWYSLDWEELPADAGGTVDVGHQLEWAWLLSNAVERGLPASYLDVATGLLAFGLDAGYDRRHGGLLSPAQPDGKLIEGRSRKGWWEQCELVRALLHHAALRGRDDLREPLEQSVRFIRERFVDHEYGGWLPAENRGDGPPQPQRKGDPYKVDYHVVGMCAEAVRLAES
jgi:mannose-6-phosphate isomerase